MRRKKMLRNNPINLSFALQFMIYATIGMGVLSFLGHNTTKRTPPVPRSVVTTTIPPDNDILEADNLDARPIGPHLLPQISIAAQEQECVLPYTESNDLFLQHLLGKRASFGVYMDENLQWKDVVLPRIMPQIRLANTMDPAGPYEQWMHHYDPTGIPKRMILEHSTSLSDRIKDIQANPDNFVQMINGEMGDFLKTRRFVDYNAKHVAFFYVQTGQQQTVAKYSRDHRSQLKAVEDVFDYFEKNKDMFNGVNSASVAKTLFNAAFFLSRHNFRAIDEPVKLSTQSDMALAHEKGIGTCYLATELAKDYYLDLLELVDRPELSNRFSMMAGFLYGDGDPVLHRWMHFHDPADSYIEIFDIGDNWIQGEESFRSDTAYLRENSLDTLDLVPLSRTSYSITNGNVMSRQYLTVLSQDIEKDILSRN
ncbi:MAG: hypothetical protein QF915_05160 [Candidatus Woesearchaeota archaeon]|nr:hypothetical protein [Candidatus Woesearchaeota archaeon]MDP7457342.1 hypothetical protein [Candidatus Woesearchaeota archaeon]